MILGHSFIRRLRDYIKSTEDSYNLRLWRENCFVSFYARGRLTINRLLNTPELNSFPQGHDICFLQIGSNDLCDQSRSVSEIGTAIHSFANFLICCRKAKKVIIEQILRRYPRVTDPQYSDRVIEISILLRSLCTSDDNVYLWHHRGFSWVISGIKTSRTWQLMEYTCNIPLWTHAPCRNMYKV